MFSVCAFSVDTSRGEIKKMQKRRKSSRRRTSVRQRRFSAVEKAKTSFRLLKESARIPTSFRKSDYTKAIIKCLVFAFSVCAFSADTSRGEIKKMQNRRKASRRRTSVRQRRFSAVEKAKTSFRLLKESARIPTSFRKSDYTKAIIKCLVFAFSVCAFSADTSRGEIKKMQNRRKASRRRTIVRQRRFSAVEKADNYFFGEIR